MKKIIFLGLIIALVGCSKNPKPVDQTAVKKYCESLDSLSNSAMTARQKGIALAEVLKVTDTVEGTVEQKKYVEEIIKQAFGETRFASAEFQEKAIVDFRNKIYLDCLNKYS
ncbi:hypothetical protein [Acinetobacter venetianus]|uniref:Lipoprotein n=1 Tax=Acinetobacter venetianus TaxID=52133 RepID=A0A150HYQ2_9GAMM|nr:hypothetical protein [Acinetobacter venetianus]KXZ72129.1 hypothetical protein AVENLUH13518_00740 [Acinetobacter venetianus]